MGARVASAMLGLWLFISPWLFATPPAAARVNDPIVGCAIVLTALGAFAEPRLRYANTVLGFWLMVAPLALGYVNQLGGQMAAFNDLAVGVFVLGFSLVPNTSVPRAGELPE